MVPPRVPADAHGPPTPPPTPHSKRAPAASTCTHTHRGLGGARPRVEGPDSRLGQGRGQRQAGKGAEGCVLPCRRRKGLESFHAPKPPLQPAPLVAAAAISLGSAASLGPV